MTLVEHDAPAARAAGPQPGTWQTLPKNPDMHNIMEALVLTLEGAASPADNMTWAYRSLPRHKVLSTPDCVHWQDNPIGTKPANTISAAGASRPGVLYASGGFGAGGLNNQFLASTNGRDWSPVLPQSQWAPRNKHCMAWFQNRVWVFGGATTNDQPLGDVWSWGDGETAWTQEQSADHPFQARFGASAVVFDGKLWALGGQLPGCQVSYSPNGRDWYDLGAPFDWRLNPRAHVLGDAMYLLGGATDALTVFTDVLCSTDGQSWSYVEGPDCPWYNGRGFGSAVVGEGADTGIAVFGGRASGNEPSPDVFKFIPAPLPPA
jgi:hypothetical protein